MRGRTLVVAVLLVGAGLLVAGTGSVAADTEVGASGSCDNGNSAPQDDWESDGGDGAVNVTASGDADLAGPEEAEDMAKAVVWFVTYSAQNGEIACDETAGDGEDYLEAHADAGEGAAAQVCIDHRTTDDGSPVLVGDDTDHDGGNKDRRCENDHHRDRNGNGDSDL